MVAALKKSIIFSIFTGKNHRHPFYHWLNRIEGEKRKNVSKIIISLSCGTILFNENWNLVTLVNIMVARAANEEMKWVVVSSWENPSWLKASVAWHWAKKSRLNAVRFLIILIFHLFYSPNSEYKYDSDCLRLHQANINVTVKVHIVQSFSRLDWQNFVNSFD